MATVLRGERSISVGTTPVKVGNYTAPTVTTGVLVFDLIISNVLGTGANIIVSAYIFDGTNNNFLVNGAVIPGGGAISLCENGTKHVLNSGDQVFVVSNTPNSANAVMGVSEIS